MKTNCIFQLLILAMFLDLSIQWSGNVCSRTISTYTSVRRCTYQTSMGCGYYKWYSVPNYKLQNFCCPGWTTSSDLNCSQPICSPPCRDGGTCVQPNICQCNDGVVGPTCNTLVCNYQRPCFPGICTTGASVNCDCSSGFTSPSPSPMESIQKPEIYEIRATLSFWQRGTEMTTIEKYSLYADSTLSNDADLVWTNREKFNWVNVTASAHYMIDNHTQPFFIKRYGIGIARAEVDIHHEKLPLTRSTPVVSLEMTLPCTPTVSDLNPTSDTYYCDITKQDYDRSLENGDKLTLTFKAWNGGYRELQELTSSGLINRGNQTYTGHMVDQSMHFRFDFRKPTHSCLSQGSSCSDELFSMTQDVTKVNIITSLHVKKTREDNPIYLRWSNWNDVLSGMYRYTWEVFKLQVDGNQVLKEYEPLKPIYGPIEVNQSSSPSNSFQATYTPTAAGVYSFILETSDKANNSVFVRRIAIYDPVSSVTIDTGAGDRLYISSADPNGGYVWQDDPSTDIKVTWTNHFVNLMHEQGKWLNQVLAYPPQLEDFLKNIPRESKQDDHEGNRTVDAIQNKRGVVKFEIAYAKDSNAGVNQTKPTTGWTDVGLSETFTIPPDSHGGPLTNRDTVVVWVRAKDVLGNTRVDSTRVHFDETPPEVEQPVLRRNLQTKKVPFSSTVEVNLRDMQSGMKRVDMSVRNMNSSLVIVNDTLPLLTIGSCNGFSTCYCTTVNPVCFNKTQFLPISNCWLKHPVLEGKTVTVDMNFVNMAGLHTTKSFTVGQLTTLNGTQSSPVDVTVTRKETNLLTLTWKHALSCYNRTEMSISYEVNGRTEMTLLHKTTTNHTLVDLEPDTAYKIVVISHYGEFKSRADPVTVTTGMINPMVPRDVYRSTCLCTCI